MPVKSRPRKSPAKSGRPPKAATALSKTASQSPTKPYRKKPAASKSKPTGPQPEKSSSGLEKRVRELESELKNASRRLQQETQMREQLESEFRLSESRFRRVFELGLIGMAITSVEKGWLEVNDRLCEIFGYPREELTRKTWSEITHPEDLPADEAHFERVLAGDIDAYHMEKRFIRKDGNIIHAEISAKCQRRTNGSVEYFVAFVQDITERNQAEEKIARSEELLKKTQRLTRVGGWDWDVQARNMFWTEETYRIHEMEPGELVPGSAEHIARSLACYDEPDRQLLLDAFRRCAEEGEHYDLDLPFTTVKGRRIWVRTVAEPVWHDGKIAKVVGNLMDITERKRSEEILQESEELFRNTFDLSPVGAVIVRLDRRFVRCNTTFCRFLGYTEGELIGKTFLEVTHAEDRHIGLEELKQLVDRDIDQARFQKRYLRKDGQVVWGEITIRLVSDQAGQPLFFLPVIQDITQRKLAEEQLELLGKIFDQTSDRVVITDMDTTIRFVNQAQCRAVKRQRDELIGKKPDVLGDDPQRGATQQQLLDATLAHGKWRGEVISIAADGAETIVDLRTFVVRDASGKALALAGIGTDITAKKMAETELNQSQEKLRELYHQLQNAREKERLRISREIHDELGQNITAMKIDLAWLRKTIDPSLTPLHDKLDSMSAITEATLATVRRVSSELRPGILDALGLAAAVEWMVKDFQARSDIQCHLCIKPEEIEASPNLSVDVFRILQEALTNILRHAQASSVAVSLMQMENMIELRVDDNGIGISLEKISQTDSLGHLGIRERLRPYGGVLRISGAPGKGTSVIATFPIQR
jgi:PAS domain S-box-containing protein